MLFQVYPDCQTLYHRLFLSQSRQALESVRWDLQSQVKVRGGSYNIKQNCQQLLVKSETEILSGTFYSSLVEIFFADYSFFILSFFLSLSISIYFILRVNYFREYDDYEIGSEEWHYHFNCTNCIFFLQTNRFIFLFSSLVLSYNTIFEIRKNLSLKNISQSVDMSTMCCHPRRYTTLRRCSPLEPCQVSDLVLQQEDFLTLR